MAIRISGLASGLDTESLVSELVSAYRYKKDNYVKAQTKLSWKQDAWKTMNSKIYSLYNNVSSLRYTSAYSLKKTTVSDTTKASVTASSSAVNGTQTLQIKKLASAGYLTGGKIATNDSSALSNTTKMSQLGFSGTGSINCNETDISISENDTINSVLNKMKSAGVNASLDTNNNRIFVSSKDSGATNEFTLTASDANGASALYTMGLSVSSESATNYYTSALSKYAVFSGTDAAGNTVTFDPADYEVKHDDVNGYYLADQDGNKVAAYDEAATKSKVKDLIADGTLNTSSFANASYALAAKQYNYAKAVQSGDTSVMEAYEKYNDAKDIISGIELTKYNATTFKELSANTEEERAKSFYDAEGKAVKISESTDSDGNTVYKDADGNVLKQGTDADGNKYYYKEDDADQTPLYKDGNAKMAEYQANLADAGLTEEQYDDALKTVNDFTKTYGADLNALENVYEAYQKTASEDPNALNQLMDESLESASSYVAGSMTNTMDMLMGTGVRTNLDAVRVEGQDAEIVLNGATFTGASNTFNINGLTINAQATTAAGETLSITTDTDAQGIYDKVKDFLSQYNELVNEMTSSYNASSAKGYEPLTSEEKDAMTDTQVEEWEAKIKASLLRRDTTLSSVLNGMTSAMSSSYIMGKNSAGTMVNFTLNKDGSYTGDDGMTYTKTSSDKGKYTFTAEDGSTVSAQNYSWSSFGIATMGYLNAAENEYNAYHIDGDEDDELTSSKKDKLMAAINENPDAVISFLKNATSKLYDSINAKMGSSDLSSIYKVYNDKEMAHEYSDYTDTIKKWEDKVSAIEDSYYKKFAAMESALATLQSQSSSLSSLLS